MDTYDVRKVDQDWKLVKEGRERALRSFDKKTDAVSFARDYVQAHGGHLRIWSADGDTLQREHTYGVEGTEPVTREPAGEAREIEVGAFYIPVKELAQGVSRGAADATRAAGRLVPQMGRYFAKGAYGASYYTAYGVVFAAVAVGKSIPLPGALARGLSEGTDAAIEAYEKGHAEPPERAATV